MSTEGPISRREGVRFAGTLALGFALVAWFTAVRGWRNASLAAAVAAAIAALAAVLVPSRLGAARAWWMAVGEGIGRITTPLILAIIYFLVVTPLAVLRRLLVRRLQRPASYWQRSPPPREAARLERQF